MCEYTTKSLSRVQLFVTPWTVACQAPLSMGFSRKEYWSGLPRPPPGDLSHMGIKPVPPALSGGFFTTEPPGKPERARYQEDKWLQRSASLDLVEI